MESAEFTNEALSELQVRYQAALRPEASHYSRCWTKPLRGVARAPGRICSSGNSKRNHKINLASWTTPKIPGINVGMESAEFTNEALLDIQVRPVERSEETRYQDQMAQHHYLGDLPKIGETLWYVATWREQWVAQLSMSAAALKCGVRDRWIGWDFRSQYGRLKLIANNSRFLILPEWHRPNIGSRVLSLTERRVGADWQARFGHPLLLLETFVDPRRFYGGVYRAANWIELGLTLGYRRTREGYSNEADAPKRVFIRPLCRNPQVQLNHPNREHLQLTGAPKIMLNAAVLHYHCRSAPLARATPSPPGGAGHRGRRDVVRHARLQGHLRLGRGLRTASPRTFRLSA